MVSLFSLIQRMCTDRDQVAFLCSRLDSRYSESMWPQREAIKPIITQVRLETQYIDIEKSISIIDRNFHIDSYRLYQ